MTTLRSLRAAHRALFHPNQDWFEGCDFMDAPLPEPYRKTPPTASRFGITKAGVPLKPSKLPLAVELAAAYILNPGADVWSGYLWCRDRDQYGNRVYVGGLSMGRGWEIHRHIFINGLWSIPIW